MFGNAGWFSARSTSPTPVPTTRNGWFYYAAWLSAVLLPASLLAFRGQIPEAAIWAALSVSALLIDLRRLNRDIRQRVALQRMHFIADDRFPGAETENYLLEIRR